MISSNFHDFDQLVPNCRKYHFLTANVQANWSPNGAGYFLEISVACMPSPKPAQAEPSQAQGRPKPGTKNPKP